MRTLILTVLVGVPAQVLVLAAPVSAQQASGGVTLSENEGSAPSAVVQVKNEVPPSAPPAAPPPAAAGTGATRASAAGMTYGRYGGAATDTEGGWGFRYNGYFRAPMNIGFGERVSPFVGQSKTTISNLQVPGREFYSW